MASQSIPALPPAPPEQRQPAYRMLCLLAAVFVLPFVIGSGLFWADWRPAKFGNHGELVQPALALPESGLRLADGSALASAQLRGKWLLVLPIGQDCDSSCAARLYAMQQAHLALNKEQSRVQRVLIGSNGLPDDVLADLQQRFPGLLVATVAEPENKRWKTVLGGDEQTIVVVDPLGMAMMRYRDATTRGVFKDMERLLKYSWIR